MIAWLKALGLAALAVIAPAKPLLIAALVLVILDAVLGVWAARKRGERVTSAGFRRTVAKLLVFQVVIIAAFVAETWLLGGALPLSKLAAGAVAVTECTSLLENAGTILGRPVFVTVIAKLGSSSNKRRPRA